jgi:prevent-host-death family protein
VLRNFLGITKVREMEEAETQALIAAQRYYVRKMVNLIELTDLTNMARVPTAEPAMETIAAADAKTNFGALLDKAQRGPVTISKNGRAVAVLMSADAYHEQQQLKLEVLRREIQKGLDDVKRGRVVSRERAFAAVGRELKKLSKK